MTDLKTFAAVLGKRGGSRRSPQKSEASRANLEKARQAKAAKAAERKDANEVSRNVAD